MKKLLLSIALVLSAGNLFGASSTWNKFKEEKLEQLRAKGTNRSASEEATYQGLLRESSGGGLSMSSAYSGIVQFAPITSQMKTASRAGEWNEFKNARLIKLKEKGASRTQGEEADYQALLRQLSRQ